MIANAIPRRFCYDLSRRMRKPAICVCENKGTYQLHSYCEADKCLCFHYTGSTIPLLSKSKISRVYPSSVLVQPGLCRTCSETTLLIFSRDGIFTFTLSVNIQSASLLHSPFLFVLMLDRWLPCWERASLQGGWLGFRP